MLRPTKDPASPSRDSGFTLIELSVVCAIVSVLIAVGGGALISLSNSANRDEALVSEQQAATGAIAQLDRDIRSASTLSIPSGATAADEIEVAVLGPSGSTTEYLWTYDPTAETFTREVASGSGWSAAGYLVADVTNGATIPVFKFFDASGSDISSTTNSNIATCTTAVDVNLYVSSSLNGVHPFQESAEVALTNQLNTLSAPGNGQCGVS